MWMLPAVLESFNMVGHLKIEGHKFDLSHRKGALLASQLGPDTMKGHNVYDGEILG